MNFLDKTGVTTLWGKVKEQVKTNVTDKLGAANGIATLDASRKLTASQLPALKTVNGNSIVGSGNITIDLSLYKVVETLPTTGIDINKIYLVANTSAPEGNEYSEYIYNNSKWELLGQYKANINLDPYAKKLDIGTYVIGFGKTSSYEDSIRILVNKKNAVNLTQPDSIIEINAATTTKSGVMSAVDKTKLDGVAAKATADSAITADELAAILV